MAALRDAGGADRSGDRRGRLRARGRRHRGPHRLRVLPQPRPPRRIRGRRPRQLRHRPRRHERLPARRDQAQQRLARLHVLVGQDLVRRAHRGAGHADRREAGLDLQEIVAADPVTHQRVGGGAVGQTRGARGEARILRRVGRLDRLAQTRERLIARARDRDPAAVARAIDVGRHHHRRLGAEAPGHLARARMAHHDLLLQPQACLVEPDVGHLPVPAAPGVEDGHQQRAGALDRGPALGQRHRDRRGRAVREAGDELHAREGLRDAVVAARARQRPGLAEGRDAQHRQTQVAPRERLRREARRLQAPGPEILDQRVGPRQQRAPLRARQLRQVCPHRELAAILRLEVERVLARQSGSALPHRRAPGRLDLDDGGAQVGQQPARQLARERLRQLDDDQAGQGPAAVGAGQSCEGRRDAGRGHRARLTRFRRCGPRCRRATSPSPSP